MNEQSFNFKQSLIQSVQRQAGTLIERSDAKSMQVLQDWKTNYVAE